MRLKLLKVWEAITISFWFIPSIFIMLAIGLAFLFVNIDANTSDIELSGLYRYFYFGGAEGARAVLSSIASSMMTIAGVVFSITIVTLTLASSQLGPRVIRNFIKSKLNQVVLGAFVATFIYCLLVLITVTDKDDVEFVPNISLLFAMVLAVLNIILLITFIHHVSNMIQADNVISNLSDELDTSINNLFAEDLGEEEGEDMGTEARLALEVLQYARKETLLARKSNYLQSVDNEQLMELTRENDLLIVFNFKPGHFLIKDTVMLTVYAHKQLSEGLIDQIYDCFTFGKQRSPTQDAEFIISQIVEIAARALSPGINDPFTAITSIDKLGSAIAELSQRRFPSPFRYDKQKKLRVIAKTVTFEGAMDAAFHQIRQYGKSNADILIRLMDNYYAIAELISTQKQKEALKKHVLIVERAGQENLAEPNDKEDLKERYQKVLERINKVS